MLKKHIARTKLTFKLVESPELMNEIFRLRFQVYCKECNFIKEEDYPQGLEMDEYESYSLHFVAEDNLGVLGAARLILDSELGFPLEEHCRDSLYFNQNLIPHNKLAEISRLVISKQYFYKRNGSSDYGSDLTKRIRPITFGIYWKMFEESKKRGIIYWYAMMEEPLWLLLNAHGLIFEPIGEEIDFYGPVRPYMAYIEYMERAFQRRKHSLSA